MAKKGGVQQLQTEINTNEELSKFLERDGLIVLDVYTEWCGPCLAMVGSLKKIKLEQGGDDLQLAVVNCDHIDAFKRFRNKSEPTWLLASKGKIVNCAFGSNVPELIDLIIKELDIERKSRDTDPSTCGRIYYELTEMTPTELIRFNAKRLQDEESERIEMEAAQKRRRDYLTFVTDEIIKNASDLGVTILMPHVMSRDLLKRLTEPADKCQLVAKDKKNVQITLEHVEIIEFECTHPIPLYLLDHINNKDLFMVCWKLATDNSSGDACKSIEEILNEFVSLVWYEATTENCSATDDNNGSHTLLKSLSIMIDANADDMDRIEIERLSSINAENKISPEKEPEILLTDDEGNKICNDPVIGQEDKITKKSNEFNEEKTKNANEKDGVSNHKVKVRIPPIWAPSNQRTNAALIYLYFRSLTEHFLPPDPIPEKPHLAIAFDAYKRKDIMDLIDEYKDDILAYGYFTTDDFETAELIANSTFSYHKNPPTIHDKFVLKVAKSMNSPTISALKEYGPCHISENTEKGKIECLAFFPIGYKVSSETGATTPIPVDVKPKKKKKKRKLKQDLDVTDEVNGKPDDINTNKPVDKESELDNVDDDEEEEDGGEMEDDDDDDDDDENGSEENDKMENATDIGDG